MFFTFKDAQLLGKNYGGQAKFPEGKTPIDFRPPKKGDYFAPDGNPSTPVKCHFDFNDELASYRLIYAKPEPKYRFICDDPTPRSPKKGEWVADTDGRAATQSTARRFAQTMNDWTNDVQAVIFRREEID